MRKPFNVDSLGLDSFNLLVYGLWNTGKTHFIGDFLKYESQFGPVRFLHIEGEDNIQTIYSSGIGDNGETVETIDDFKSFVAEYSKKPLVALGVDSLIALSVKVMQSKVGDRLPSIKSDGNEWGEVHLLMANVVSSLRKCAKYVVCTSPADRESDPITGEKYLAPMLPGRQSREIIGKFNFVGYMSTTALGSKIRRTLSFKPERGISTRWSGRNVNPGELVMPDGFGGWEAFKKAALGE